MVLAGLFAGVLFLGLILGDWLYFVRFTRDAIRYGCSVARSHDPWPTSTIETVRSRFSANSVLMLPHGIARFYPDVSQIAIRPQYRFFSIGFRSAWPVKGLIHLSAGNQAMDALCVKRIPWSSALMTLLWFGVVLTGSLMFVVTYAWDGGFASLEGMLMGVGLIAGSPTGLPLRIRQHWWRLRPLECPPKGRPERGPRGERVPQIPERALLRHTPSRVVTAATES